MLKKMIIAKLVHNLLAVLVLLTIGVAGVATQENIIADRPPVAGSPAQVLADCQPVAEGQFPTGAVLRKTDGTTVKVTRPALVSKAFDTALGERTWNGVTNISLCG